MNQLGKSFLLSSRGSERGIATAQEISRRIFTGFYFFWSIIRDTTRFTQPFSSISPYLHQMDTRRNTTRFCYWIVNLFDPMVGNRERYLHTLKWKWHCISMDSALTTSVASFMVRHLFWTINLCTNVIPNHLVFHLNKMKKSIKCNRNILYLFFSIIYFSVNNTQFDCSRARMILSFQSRSPADNGHFYCWILPMK